MKKRRLIIGALFAIIILVLLYKQINFGNLQDLKIKIDYRLLATAFLLFAFTTVLLAKRFNYVLHNILPLVSIFKIFAFYTLYNKLFPGGIGELSFIYLIKKKVERPIPSGLSCIIITRVLDLLSTAAFSLVALIAVREINIDRWKYIVAVVIFVIVALLMVQNISRVIEKITGIFNDLIKSNSVLWNKIKDNLKRTTDILKINKKKNLSLFCFTFLIFGINYLITQIVFLSFGLRLNYFEAVLVGTMSTIISLIPINTFGSFGYKEAGIALVLVLMGVVKDHAIIYSFLLHLTSIVFMLLMVLVGVLINVKLTRVKELIKAKIF